MYFVINIQKTKEGTSPATLFSYDSYENASVAYHSNLQYNYTAKENLTGFSCSIMTDNGDVVLKESYNFPVEE